MRTRKFQKLPEHIIAEIVRRYPDEKTEKIATDLEISINTIYRKATSLGLKKSEEFLNSPESGRLKKGECRGVRYQFKKGHTPSNKGKKMDEFMSEETMEKFKQNQFRKGNKPHNTQCDGYISTRNFTDGHVYKFIRIKENQWELLHRVIWEKNNGPIPQGYKVRFIDGDQMNCKISNLEMISDQELLNKNRITVYPENIQKAIKLSNKLLKIIKRYE